MALTKALAVLRRVRSPLQLRNTRFDVFDFDGLCGLVHDAFGGPYPDGCRRSWVNHRLQQRGGCGRSALLEARDGLRVRGPAGLSVGRLKFGEFKPAKEGSSGFRTTR